MISGRNELFWAWFRRNADRISADPDNPVITGELDRRVSELHGEISWEIGPGLSKSWQLVFSPNLNPDLRVITRDIVRDAPSIDDWEFFSSRRPKQWEYRFELARDNDERVTIDASEWRFILLRYPDGQHEIVLGGSHLPELSESESWQAAAIVLESILGEEMLMNPTVEFRLLRHLPLEMADKARPIQQLSSAINGGAESRTQ
jgi:hypothetical protein